ncbi:unnamed protein product, partial [Notodromas monacha]
MMKLRQMHLFVTGSPPTEVLKFFPQLHQDLHYFGPNAEMSVKLHNDYWVVAKKADQREVYIVMSQRNMTLLETSDELNRLFASQFSNIFLLTFASLTSTLHARVYVWHGKNAASAKQSKAKARKKA